MNDPVMHSVSGNSNRRVRTIAKINRRDSKSVSTQYIREQHINGF